VPYNAEFAEYRQGMAALALRLAGATYVEIMEALGLSTPDIARRAVENSLANQVTTEDREHLRREESARLERLLRGVWLKATDAAHPEHLAAVKVALSITDRRARLLGLDAPQEVTIHSPTADELDRWVANVQRATMADYVALEASVVESPALPPADVPPPA
jgi:hypothetical protein